MIQRVVSLPRDNGSVRRTVYNGSVFSVGACAESLALTKLVERIVEAEFGSEFRTVHQWAKTQDLQHSIRKLKDDVYMSEDIRDACETLMKSLNFTHEGVYDPPRLRVIAPSSPLDPDVVSAPAYAAHRDTWYANPQSQINFWLSLHDVEQTQTFSFYPAFFKTAIENDSHKFEFDDWFEKVGFGNSHLSRDAYYPMPTIGRPSADRALGFDAHCADVLVFSAAQLHASNINTSDVTRFSIDFRYVNREDEDNKIGAPNMDNHSLGSAMFQYVPLRVGLCKP